MISSHVLLEVQSYKDSLLTASASKNEILVSVSSFYLHVSYALFDHL